MKCTLLRCRIYALSSEEDEERKIRGKGRRGERWWLDSLFFFKIKTKEYDDRGFSYLTSPVESW